MVTGPKAVAAEAEAEVEMADRLAKRDGCRPLAPHSRTTSDNTQDERRGCRQSCEKRVRELERKGKAMMNWRYSPPAWSHGG